MLHVVFWFFLLASVSFALNRLAIVWHAHVSRGWPAIPSRIDLSRPDRANDTEGEPPAYRLAIRYTYVPGGGVLTGTRLFFGDDLWTLTGAQAEQLRAKYSAGAAVQVYYDPRHPERAVLQPGIHVGTIVGFAVSLFVAAIASYMFTRAL